MISLKAEKIFEVLDFPITNTLLMSWLTVIFLFGLFFYLRRQLREKPGKFQSLLEIFLEGINKFFQGIFQTQNHKLFAFALTFFIFILVSNWLGLLPGVGSIFVLEGHQRVPLFRSAYSDVNMTLTLALISVVGANILGLYYLGGQFLKRYKGFVGLLELFAEFAKIISFSFRLFGNIFAGEVLLTVMALLFAYIVPLPFLGLELFVGFIQAVIFFVLTTIFLKVELTSEH